MIVAQDVQAMLEHFAATEHHHICFHMNFFMHGPKLRLHLPLSANVLPHLQMRQQHHDYGLANANNVAMSHFCTCRGTVMQQTAGCEASTGLYQMPWSTALNSHQVLAIILVLAARQDI